MKETVVGRRNKNQFTRKKGKKDTTVDGQQILSPLNTRDSNNNE